MYSYKINEIINTILEDRTLSDIIKDFNEIKSLAINICETVANYNKIENKEEFVEMMLKNIYIKGMSLNELERKHEEIHNYQELNHILDIMNIFTKKEVKLILDGKEITIEVFDTGNQYIPTDQTKCDEKTKAKLKELKEKERIEQIADIIENGQASIYLDTETKEKVDEEIRKRHEKSNIQRPFTQEPFIEENFANSDFLFNPFQKQDYQDEEIEARQR